MHNLWSQKCSELRSHSQYHVKLSIITSLEQRESLLPRGKCYGSPSYSRHRIVSANKSACKLLNKLQTVITVIKFHKAFTHSYTANLIMVVLPKA